MLEIDFHVDSLSLDNAIFRLSDTLKTQITCNGVVLDENIVVSIHRENTTVCEILHELLKNQYSLEEMDNIRYIPKGNQIIIKKIKEGQIIGSSWISPGILSPGTINKVDTIIIPYYKIIKDSIIIIDTIRRTHYEIDTIRKPRTSINLPSKDGLGVSAFVGGYYKLNYRMESEPQIYEKFYSHDDLSFLEMNNERIDYHEDILFENHAIYASEFGVEFGVESKKICVSSGLGLCEIEGFSGKVSTFSNRYIEELDPEILEKYSIQSVINILIEDSINYHQTNFTFENLYLQLPFSFEYKCVLKRDRMCISTGVSFISNILVNKKNAIYGDVNFHINPIFNKYSLHIKYRYKINRISFYIKPSFEGKINHMVSEKIYYNNLYNFYQSKIRMYTEHNWGVKNWNTSIKTGVCFNFNNWENL